MTTLLRLTIRVLFALIPARALNTVLDVLARRIEATGNVWFTYHLRPHKSLPLRFYKSGIIEQKTAVIIQGPILENHDFTLSSVEMYRRIIPGAHLIVSTWKNAPEYLVEHLRTLNAEVVLSEPPQISGIANVNYQIISSRAGIDAAVKSGRTFILKCRTDQRFFAPGIFEFFENLMRDFPVRNTDGQRERIIATSLNTFMYRPYSLSDMFLFGTLTDMQKYLDVPLDNRTGRPDYPNLAAWARDEPAEAQLVLHFLRETGHDPKFTLRDSWQVFADRFCIVDAESIDLYWPKYDRMREYRYRFYDQEKTNRELRWMDWLNLYHADLNDIEVPEDVLNKAMGDAL